MRIAIIITVVVCLLLLLSQVAGQEQQVGSNAESKTPTQQTDATEGFDFWMNVKLVESQKVFAALAQEDYQAITESSKRLKTVSNLEGFVRRKTPGYSTQLKAFEFSLDEILHHAKNENIEGVTLGFQQLTLSCVNCHKQLRQQ